MTTEVGLSPNTHDQRYPSESKERYMKGLYSLSNLDGRDVMFTGELRNYLSEGALHRYRGVVEIEALIALSESDFDRRPRISEEEKGLMRSLVVPGTFNSEIVAEYDHYGRNGSKPLEHDVKSVEMYLRERFDEVGLEKFKEWIHFPMTSEDVNNIAWNLMLRDAMNNVYVPGVLNVMDKLSDFSVRYAHVAVVGKTHGMDASPTTMGKRFSTFLENLMIVMEKVGKLRFSAKMSGPVGNNNAMDEVAPEFDYRSFAREFVKSFGFDYEENANQRSNHLANVDLLDHIKTINTLIGDLHNNVKRNIEAKLIEPVLQPGQTGSSVMPHKINPWYFEQAKGMVEQSNQLINGAKEGLLESDFERDMTDHAWERAYGEMLGKSIVGLAYVSDGLDTLRVDDQRALEELRANPAVLSEVVQIAGRVLGVQDIYMKIKLLTQGRTLTREVFDQIVDENIPDEEMRARLHALTPEKYIGDAAEIAEETSARYEIARENLKQGVLDDLKQTDAVIFDFDGTLQVGDKDELNARLTAIATSLGMGFTPEEILEFGNRSDYNEMRALMVRAYNERSPASSLTEETFQTANNAVSGQFDDKFRLADGTLELLASLKAAGKKIGLVTTRGANSLPRLLENYGIRDYFDAIVNRADCAERKPHPKPVAIGLRKLGVTDPSRAIYVGDHPIDDVVAGNALEMRTILVNEAGPQELGAIPTQHIKSLRPFIKRVQRSYNLTA